MRWKCMGLFVFGVWFGVACGDDGGGTIGPGAKCDYEGHTFHDGDEFPAGDGCNSCQCIQGAVLCTAAACDPVDGGVVDPASCRPSGGCGYGPVCGELCCGAGERCASGTCVCGAGSACASGDSCAAAGPSGENGCGTVCCGGSGPCPQ